MFDTEFWYHIAMRDLCGIVCVCARVLTHTCDCMHTRVLAWSGFGIMMFSCTTLCSD